MSNIEYRMIDVVGASEFGEALTEMAKQGWMPWMNHIIYLKGGRVHYTIVMSKHISQ